MTPVESTTTCSATSPSASPTSAAVRSASAIPVAPVAAFATPALITTACGSALLEVPFRDHDGRRQHAVRRPHGRPDGRHGASGRAQGPAPTRRMPACTPLADEPLGGRDGHQTRTPESRSPVVSSSPKRRLTFWIACPAAPLPRLSSAQMTIVRSRRADPRRPRSRRRPSAGRARAPASTPSGEHVDDVAVRVVLLEQSAQVGASRANARTSRAVRGARAAGAERTSPGKPSCAAISGACWCCRRDTARRSRAPLRHASDARGARPAPVIPDFASTTTPVVLDLGAIGASASSAAVA